MTSRIHTVGCSIINTESEDLTVGCTPEAGVLACAQTVELCSPFIIILRITITIVNGVSYTNSIDANYTTETVM